MEAAPGDSDKGRAGSADVSSMTSSGGERREKPRKTGFHIFFLDIRRVFRLDELGQEILRIAVPAALALAADPLASLVDTAFIGRLGSVEIAAVGVSIAIFNQVSKICIYPLVSVTTSFVAEEDAIMSRCVEEVKGEDLERACPANAETEELPPRDDSEKIGCTASFVPKFCGGFGGKRRYIPSVSSALIVGGVESPMLAPALRYLTLRSLGAPAVLLSLAMQGVFRGFKDTKTPLYATGFLLLARVIAVTFCVTLAASLAARHGPISMAAFQVCLQLWLATSLLADGLAVAGQAILATSFAKGDHDKVVVATARILQDGSSKGAMDFLVEMMLVQSQQDQLFV
ncbi:MatE [Musa troglodytarum]|uniref:MatE n=1 Tax=Musa troglodytarum TaxID=320322 RepID=A0A9E7HAA8_9LILI|nr:MatE [Musa troglodytarum]